MTVFGGTTKVQPYAVISLDCSASITDSAQGAIILNGVSTTSWMANSITIVSLGGNTVSFRLGSTSNGLITASDGLSLNGIPFDEIYWTVVAGSGTAEIVIAWV